MDFWIICSVAYVVVSGPTHVAAVVMAYPLYPGVDIQFKLYYVPLFKLFSYICCLNDLCKQGM